MVKGFDGNIGGCSFHYSEGKLTFEVRIFFFCFFKCI